jgi:uncharacterized protein
MRQLSIFFLYLLSTSLSGQVIKTTQFHGKEILVYPDSITTLWERIPLIDSLPDGKYFGFYNGDTSWLRLEITYLNNRINGEVIEYNSNPPTRLYLTTFKNGTKDGHWIEYSDDTILHEGYYSNDKQDGFAYSYAGPDGQKSEYAKYFYRNDTLKYKIWHKYDSTYFVGDTGYVYESNYTGKLLGFGKEIHGDKFGLWKYYYINGQIKSIGDYLIVKHSDSFSESRKNGKWIDYFENGQISREYICDSKWKINDNIITVISQFDSTGKSLDTGTLKDGIGIYKEYFPDGSILIEARYLKPCFPVWFKQYYENGILRIHFKYKKNNKFVSLFYYPTGILNTIEKSVYNCDPDSDIISPSAPAIVKRYDESGKELKTVSQK